MMRIIAYFLVHVYVYIITRVVNYLYQTRIIDFDGKLLSFFDRERSSEFLNVVGIIIIVSSVLRLYASFTVVFLLVALVRLIL